MGKNQHDETDDDDRRIGRMFKRFKKDPNIVSVGKIHVDVKGAVERKVACSDGLCMQNRRGRKLAGKTCCTTFRVPIERVDVERISRVVEEVAQIRDVGRAIEKAGGWWKVDDGTLWLEDRPSGACIFLSAAKGERPWCTIHEWAANHGEEFRDYKPETCCLFPIYVVECGDETLVTSYASPYMLEADPDEADDIRSFDCLHPPKGVGRAVIVEQADELRFRLGTKAWGRVEKKLRKLGHAV